MKLINWALLLASVLVVLFVLFNFEIWAAGWKDLFFYQDNWLMYLFLTIMVIAIGLIIKKLYVIEFKIFK